MAAHVVETVAHARGARLARPGSGAGRLRARPTAAAAIGQERRGVEPQRGRPPHSCTSSAGRAAARPSSDREDDVDQRVALAQHAGGARIAAIGPAGSPRAVSASSPSTKRERQDRRQGERRRRSAPARRTRPPRARRARAARGRRAGGRGRAVSTGARNAGTNLPARNSAVMASASRSSKDQDRQRDDAEIVAQLIDRVRRASAGNRARERCPTDDTGPM